MLGLKSETGMMITGTANRKSQVTQIGRRKVPLSFNSEISSSPSSWQRLNVVFRAQILASQGKRLNLEVIESKYILTFKVKENL